MAVVLASPSGSPSSDVSSSVSKVALTHEWVAADGSVYTLSDWTTGLFLEGDKGVEGLHFPLINRFKSQSSAFHGERLRGWRAESRAVFWPLQIWADAGSAAWVARCAAFFATLHPDAVGTWRVGLDGQFRSLRCTGVYGTPHLFNIDPVLAAWSSFAVELEAVQPFWTGSPIRRKFVAGEAVDFIDGTAPPFHISSASTYSSASITNPGDVPAFPVWELDGPHPEISVGVGGRVVEVPFDIPEGERLRIDTDPRNVTALMGDIPSGGAQFAGADVTEDLGFQQFAAIPSRGGSVPLEVTTSGTGSVSVELVPLYLRAF